MTNHSTQTRRAFVGRAVALAATAGLGGAIASRGSSHVAGVQGDAVFNMLKNCDYDPETDTVTIKVYSGVQIDQDEGWTFNGLIQGEENKKADKPIVTNTRSIVEGKEPEEKWMDKFVEALNTMAQEYGMGATKNGAPQFTFKKETNFHDANVLVATADIDPVHLNGYSAVGLADIDLYTSADNGIREARTVPLGVFAIDPNHVSRDPNHFEEQHLLASGSVKEAVSGFFGFDKGKLQENPQTGTPIPNAEFAAHLSGLHKRVAQAHTRGIR